MALEDKYKRINPDTNKFFVRGDKRPEGEKQDGRVFNCYSGKIRVRGDLAGTYGEDWQTIEAWEKQKKGSKDNWHNNRDYWLERSKDPEKRKIDNQNKYNWAEKNKDKARTANNRVHTRKRERLKEEGIYRLNKEGKQFLRGEVENGKYFWNYRTGYLVGKYYAEVWFDDINDFWKNKIRTKMNEINKQIRDDYKSRMYTADKVDADYLWSIFPKDNPICPITKVPFDTLRRSENSAELDRIDNNLGYQKGNVVWVSKKINFAKRTLSLKEIESMNNFYNKLLKKGTPA